MIADKKLLRNRFKAIRNNSSSREKDALISEVFFDSEEYISADVIFLYFSVGSEVGTDAIMTRTLKDGKKIAFPKCLDKDGNMDFYFVSSPEKELIHGEFSLMEPDTRLCQRVNDYSDGLCIVPALAYDKQGYRLGYGRGYYDRFLRKFKGKTIGLCYEECFCDALPYNEFDERIGKVITDKKIYELK